MSARAAALAADRLARVLEDVRHDLRVMWRSGGSAAVRDAILWRTWRRVYSRQRLLVVEHDLARRDGARMPPGVDVRVLAERDWTPLARALTTRTVDQFRRRVGAGRTGIVAWRGERPVGFAWISPRIDRRHEYLPIPLPSDGVYCWHLWVEPAERDRGVGSALAGARLGHAAERGFRRAWRLIEADNLASWRTVEKSAPAGVQVLREASFVTILGRTRARYEPPGPDARALDVGMGST